MKTRDELTTWLEVWAGWIAKDAPMGDTNRQLCAEDLRKAAALLVPSERGES